MKVGIQPTMWGSEGTFHWPDGRKGLMAAALVVALTACSREGGEMPPQGPPTVGIWSVEERSVAIDVELPGRTSPYAIAEVRPQVGGLILKRLFSEGSDVKEGQALYQIDPTRYQANRESAQAALAQAEANLVTTRLKAERYKQLAEVKAIGQQEADDASAAYKSAVASVQSAKAALDLATINLKYTHVYAPVAGRIGKSSVTQGALVTAEQSAPLATVQQLDPIYVDLTQSSAELLQLRRELAAGRLQDNQTLPVSILMEDGSTFEHKGTLEFSEVSVDPATGSFGLRVKVDNPDGLLMPGTYVRAVIGGGVRSDAVLVPMAGIARDPKGDTSAMVVDKDNKVEVRPVKVSRTVGDKWLVEDGLKAGDKVIVEGLQKIGPGMPVKATEKGAAPAKPAAAAQPAAPAGDAK